MLCVGPHFLGLLMFFGLAFENRIIFTDRNREIWYLKLTVHKVTIVFKPKQLSWNSLTNEDTTFLFFYFTTCADTTSKLKKSPKNDHYKVLIIFL